MRTICAPCGCAGGARLTSLPSLHSLDRAQGARIWLAAEAADMRCGFDRLAERVRAVIGQDPLGGHLFVFRSRRGRPVEDSRLGPRRLRAVVQAPGGGRVSNCPKPEAGAHSVELRASELAMVLDGIDMSRLKRVPRYERGAAANHARK